jgi:hypothetical protein
MCLPPFPQWVKVQQGSAFPGLERLGRAGELRPYPSVCPLVSPVHSLEFFQLLVL